MMRMMRSLLVVAVSLVASVSVSPAVIKWERGWKTHRVIATRMQNDAMGYFVSFTFPLDSYNCDRAEVFDFFEAHAGWTFEGGGRPGAPICVKFKHVSDRASADKKIVTLLPKLDALMRDLANGVPIPKPPQPKIVDKRGKEWPECIPPDLSEPFAEFNNNVNANGTQYKCSAKGRWIVDEVAMERKRKHANERAQLLAALTQRRLTHAELLRVDSWLNTYEMQPFSAAVKYAELYDLLIRQYELQSGVDLPVKTPLSHALGEYNRAPQENDNRRAVEDLITKLQKMTEHESANAIAEGAKP